MAASNIRVLIIEDEAPAQKRIAHLVSDLSDEVVIVAVLDSVEDTVLWVKTNGMPDLAFCDIQLADGLSFNIFERVTMTCPIIFTTAFDEYAIRAFKVNSIDYLLKPIEPSSLAVAWKKFMTVRQSAHPDYLNLIKQIKTIRSGNEYKRRFLIKVGNQYKYLPVENIKYFYSESSKTHVVDQSNKRYILDDGLDEIIGELDPATFFRISRKYILSDRCIEKISTYFNSRLILSLSPSMDDEVIVSRDRVKEFKRWLGQ